MDIGVSLGDEEYRHDVPWHGWRGRPRPKQGPVETVEEVVRGLYAEGPCCSGNADLSSREPIWSRGAGLVLLNANHPLDS